MYLALFPMEEISFSLSRSLLVSYSLEMNSAVFHTSGDSLTLLHFDLYLRDFHLITQPLGFFQAMCTKKVFR